MADAKDTARLKEQRASFGDSCQWLVDIESAPHVDHTGSPAALIPRLDGFAAEVSTMIPIAGDLVVRLKEPDPSTAPGVLAEFGLSSSASADSSRLARILAAAEVMVRRSQSLVRVWPISGEDEREMQAADVAEAAKRLLVETRGA